LGVSLHTDILKGVWVGMRRGWAVLSVATRGLLLDSLCSNLSVLCSSCSSLLASSGAAAAGPEVAASIDAHRTALKMYVFFISWIATTAEADFKTEGSVEARSVKSSLSPYLSPASYTLY
jgi:hypothetical protein